MAAKIETIHEPQTGTSEITPPISREEGERLLHEQRRAFARRRRLHPDGSVEECPMCHARAFTGRSDLAVTMPTPRGPLAFENLRGAKCAKCGAQSLEGWEMIGVEREAEAAAVAGPDYEAKVSNIGSGTVGTYWPKDVVRLMGLTPQTRVFIRVLDPRTAILRFVRGKRTRKATTRRGAR